MALKVLAEFYRDEPFYKWLKESFERRGIKAEFRKAKADEERLKFLGGYEVIVASAKLGTREIDAAERLKMIHTQGIGFDHIDIGYASKRGIVVCNVGGTIAETVAEHAWSLILALARRIVWGHMTIVEGAHLAQNYWGYQLGHDVWGKTIGIIGLGNVGRRVARIAYAFNMRILAYDPYLTEDVAQMHNTELVDLETLFKSSDFVCMCTPLTESSGGMIRARELSLMKRTAYLVNVARGKVVQERALIQALQKGLIAGAGLDVFEKEPLPLESPLRKLKNVILTPHSAGPSEELAEKAMDVIAENVSRFMKGEKPRFIVNREQLARLQSRG